MDNKTLRKGFTTFAEHFKNDVFLLNLLDENGEKSSEDIITMFINDLSTEKVLEYVNTHMEIVPALQINVNGEDVVRQYAYGNCTSVTNQCKWRRCY